MDAGLRETDHILRARGLTPIAIQTRGFGHQSEEIVCFKQLSPEWRENSYLVFNSYLCQFNHELLLE